MRQDQLFYFQCSKLQGADKEKRQNSIFKHKSQWSRVQGAALLSSWDSSRSAFRNLGFLLLHGEPAPDQVHSLCFWKIRFLS